MTRKERGRPNKNIRGECNYCSYMCLTPDGAWKCLCDSSKNFKKLLKDCNPCVCFRQEKDYFGDVLTFKNEDELSDYMNNKFF